MTRYLLDTNAVGDFMHGRHLFDEKIRTARLRGDVIGTCEPVIAELHVGIENSATRDQNLKSLNRALGSLKCWPLTRSASREFGRLMVEQRRNGNEVAPMDGLIAAIALTLPHCVVVSCDSDLLRVPGLKVENWRG